MPMETGLIFHPYMKPERTARQTFDWGVQSAIAADKAGFSSMMISEHASQRWENIPNPELIIAAAALQTSRIKFAPMAHILPHQHPAKLAIMIGWLSQILEAVISLASVQAPIHSRLISTGSRAVKTPNFLTIWFGNLWISWRKSGSVNRSSRKVNIGRQAIQKRHMLTTPKTSSICWQTLALGVARHPISQ